MAMNQGTPTSPADVAKQVRELLSGRHVCPFCGGQRANPAIPCPRCTMQDTEATRAATIARVGPWFVLQTRNPSAPGMKWATLISLVRRGQVGPRSVVRGPTTSQLWTFAANVRGLSREMGVCHACGDPVTATTSSCPTCGRSQDPPMNPDLLLETHADPEPAPLVMRELTAPAPTPAGSLQIAPPRPAHVRREPRPRVAPANESDDSILTASELAAAFQLGVGPARSRWKTARRIVATLLLLGIVGAGVAIYLDPSLRERTVAAGQRAMAWAQEQVASLRAGPTPTPGRPLPNPATLPTQPTQTAESDPPEPLVPPTIALPPEPPVVTNPPIESPIIPLPVLPGELAAIDPDLERLPVIDQSRQLYRRAIDAIARDDYARALRLLQAIETLPANVHPGDLQTQLQFVRQRLAAGVR